MMGFEKVSFADGGFGRYKGHRRSSSSILPAAASEDVNSRFDYDIVW